MAVICLLAAMCGAARAQVLLQQTWSQFQGQSALTIPDMNPAGVTDSQSIFAGKVAEFVEILSIRISVVIHGDYNGDLYAYVQHGNTMAVLLNRPGRTISQTFGYSDPGMSITLTDTALAPDIHNYQAVTGPLSSSPNGAALTGLWSADGRNVDPSVALNTSQRTANLGNFRGQNVNGDWTIFVADLSGGGQNQLVSWGVQAVVVPEPRETSLATALILGGAAFVIRRKRRA